MGMQMMNVRVMRMLVLQCSMPVPVNMVVAGYLALKVLMLMVLIM